MERVNKTTVKEFILLAFSSFQQFQILFFIVILLMYMISIMGNFFIIILVKTGPSLHSPMYFFICIFAALEISFVCVTIPKLLANLISASRLISFINCFVQLYVFNALGMTECCLLSAMAFDRNLAINHPLRYSTIMNDVLCIALVTLPFTIGFVITFILTVFTAELDFCGPNQINHFLCDFAPLQSLACSNPLISILVTNVAAIVVGLTPFMLIIGFYLHIIITITKIKSAEGKLKAFSTCSSHLTVACLFYTSVIIVYVKPKGSQYDMFLALMYTVVIPMLNPFIYTLRNKDRFKILDSETRDDFISECSKFLANPEFQATNISTWSVQIAYNLFQGDLLVWAAEYARHKNLRHNPRRFLAHLFSLQDADQIGLCNTSQSLSYANELVLAENLGNDAPELLSVVLEVSDLVPEGAELLGGASCPAGSPEVLPTSVGIAAILTTFAALGKLQSCVVNDEGWLDTSTVMEISKSESKTSFVSPVLVITTRDDSLPGFDLVVTDSEIAPSPVEEQRILPVLFLRGSIKYENL
ncbi:olfactory receptor 6N1-like [Hyperolius riggenbachi]|uniref:olfactory receptor 6N1-like n=1 Tax=Hyperolius riggenbachi TaxID=752182 RepID=UPI0035A26666